MVRLNGCLAEKKCGGDTQQRCLAQCGNDAACKVNCAVSMRNCMQPCTMENQTCRTNCSNN